VRNITLILGNDNRWYALEYYAEIANEIIGSGNSRLTAVQDLERNINEAKMLGIL